MHESWQPLLELALARTAVIEFLPLPGQPGYTRAMHETRTVTEEPASKPGFVIRTTRCETPTGPLFQVQEASPMGNTAQTVKHLIETAEDADRFMSLPDDPLQPDLTALPALDQAVGDSGLVSIQCPEPGCWVHAMLGSTRLAYWTVDERERLHQLYDKIQRNQEALITTALGAAPGRLFCSGCGAEKWIPPSASPQIFEEFVAPSVQRIAAIVHENNGLLWYHCHGAMRRFITRFAELGVDCLQPVEAPPFGDVTLPEAKRLAAGRMCLEGNLSWGDVVGGDQARVRAMVRKALEEGAPGGGFILGLTAGLHGPFLGSEARRGLETFVLAATGD